LHKMAIKTEDKTSLNSAYVRQYVATLETDFAITQNYKYHDG